MTESIARELAPPAPTAIAEPPRSRSRRVRALSRTETLVLRDLVHLLEELLGAIDQIATRSASGCSPANSAPSSRLSMSDASESREAESAESDAWVCLKTWSLAPPLSRPLVEILTLARPSAPTVR